MARRSLVTTAVLAATLMIPTLALAQRGGGGSRGGGGGGGFAAKARLDTLEESFKLTKDQKKAVKTILDDAQKSAAPVRDALLKSHAALGSAVQTNKPQADIDAATKAYAEQAAAMASIEMKALADVLKSLDKEQMANTPAVTSAFFLMRNAFLTNKWDDIPDNNKPGY